VPADQIAQLISREQQDARLPLRGYDPGTHVVRVPEKNLWNTRPHAIEVLSEFLQQKPTRQNLLVGARTLRQSARPLGKLEVECGRCRGSRSRLIPKWSGPMTAPRRPYHGKNETQGPGIPKGSHDVLL
jgi:hypothetical protein